MMVVMIKWDYSMMMMMMTQFGMMVASSHMFHLPAMFTTAGVTCTFIIRSTIPIISKLMLHHLFLT